MQNVACRIEDFLKSQILHSEFLISVIDMPGNSPSMFFYTYVLQSLKDGDHYIGYTNNLVKRFEEHNSGKNFSTRPRRPFKLIYYEACLNKEDAKQREKYLKSTIGRRFLKRRLRKFYLS